MAPNKIIFGDDTYTLIDGNGKILVYVNQPEHYYQDWSKDGGILIIDYNPLETPEHQLLIISQLRVFDGTGNITTEDLHRYHDNENVYAEIID